MGKKGKLTKEQMRIIAAAIEFAIKLVIAEGIAKQVDNAIEESPKKHRRLLKRIFKEFGTEK